VSSKIVNMSVLTEMTSPRLRQMSSTTPSPLKTESRVITHDSRVRKKFDGRRHSEDQTPPSGKDEQDMFNMRDLRRAVDNKEIDMVYFPVDVQLDNLKDWEAIHTYGGEDARSGGTMVTVNNTEVAIFRYGDTVLATGARCPHAGGPLHLGDIEVLPDKSLCVRCPWHRWAFCVGRSGGGQEGGIRRNLFGGRKGAGECVFPPGRQDEGVKLFPALVDKKRKTVKIGFESFDSKTLMEEQF